MNYYNEIESYIKKNKVNKKARVIEENQDILVNYWNRSGYNRANLFKFRQFYLMFPNISTVWRQLTWSHFRELLTIKEENKRNYYINLCIKKNLSVRELIKEIKSNAYERLIDKPEKIELITISKKTTILENMKNPILLELDE